MSELSLNDLKSKIFADILSQYNSNYIIDKLFVHRGTFNRWVQKNEIPSNYIVELNNLLNEKYDLSHIINEKTKDQFYTTIKTSTHCYNLLLNVLKKLDIDESKYTFIEPSAGCGYFYNLLPETRRIGIDIDPKIPDKEIIHKDYLLYKPNSKNNIIVGNPPFGLRGNLALRFINHSYNFADIVAFILPQLFNSDGKGSTKSRVKGYRLAYSENLPLDSFQYPNGKSVSVATLFQVWTKINVDKIKINKQKTCKSFIKVYSLSDGGTPSSTRNKDMLYKCDVYLPSTCFSKMRAYSSFEELPHRRGYGIVFLKEESMLKNLFYKNINWEDEAFLSTNSALNLRTSLIEEAIMKSGVIDNG